MGGIFGAIQQSESDNKKNEVNTCWVYGSFNMFSFVLMFVWLDLKIGAKFEYLKKVWDRLSQGTAHSTQAIDGLTVHLTRFPVSVCLAEY